MSVPPTARSRPPDPERRTGGFTLVQALFALAILGLIAGLAVPLASQVISADRSSRARDQLVQLRTALVGPQDGSAGAWEPDFGYLGDFGALPDSLPPLLHRGSRPLFQVSGPARIGVGWRGPYVPIQLMEDTTEVHVDPFGRAIRYVTADTTLPDGTVWDAHLRSAGPDGEFGTGDDLIEAIPRDRTRGDLVGVVTDTSGAPQDSIDVGVTFRRDGSLVDTVLTTDAQGEYRVDDLAFGTVAVALGSIGSSGGDTVGDLQYVSGSAEVSGGGNPSVEFSVKNTGTTTIDIEGWQAIYDDQTANNQTIYYGRVDQQEPVNRSVFNVNDNCPGSGTSITFSDQVTVSTGTGSTKAVAPNAVRTLAVDGPEVSVEGSTGRLQVITISGAGNAQVRFEIRGFATGSNCKGGSNLDLTNRSFQISFSDGSTITFTTPSTTS